MPAVEFQAVQESLDELREIALKFEKNDGRHAVMTDEERTKVQEVATGIARLVGGIEWPTCAVQIPHDDVTVDFALRKSQAKTADQLLKIFERCPYDEEKWAGSAFGELRGKLPNQRVGVRLSICPTPARSVCWLDYTITPPRGSELPDVRYRLQQHGEALESAFKQKAKAYKPSRNEPFEVRVPLWEKPVDAIGADNWLDCLIERWQYARQGICVLYRDHGDQFANLLRGLGFKRQSE
jgi:hypothetical protein